MQGCGFKVVEGDIQDMMMEIDEDGAGDVDLHEFLTVMSRRSNPDIEAELIDIFKVYYQYYYYYLFYYYLFYYYYYKLDSII